MKISITDLFNRMDTEEKQEMAKLLAQEQSILCFDAPDEALDFVLNHFYSDEILNRMNFDDIQEYAKDNDDTPVSVRNAISNTPVDELATLLENNVEIPDLLSYMDSDTVREYVVNNWSMEDLYDGEDILNYVKENYSLDDVVEFC